MLRLVDIAGHVQGTQHLIKTGGWLSWSTTLENGDWVLTVKFEDSETKRITEQSWVLTPYLPRTKWGVRRSPLRR
jgi:hypothetical protein